MGMQMRKKAMNVALFPARGSESEPDTNASSGSAQLGTVVALNADGFLVVEIAGFPAAPVPARLAVALTPARVQAAIDSRQPVVLVFENGQRSQPIVVGLLEAHQPADAANDATDEAPVIEADVDGRRVRVTAKDEIVLECGSASITLRRNGRIVIRGSYVETHSDGTNRIKGGQVQIN